MTPEFVEYQKAVVRNAARMGEEFVKLGYSIVSGGTDTHLILLDVRPKVCLLYTFQAVMHVAHRTRTVHAWRRCLMRRPSP